MCVRWITFTRIHDDWIYSCRRTAGGLKLGGWYSVCRSSNRPSSIFSRSGRDVERSLCYSIPTSLRVMSPITSSWETSQLPHLAYVICKVEDTVWLAGVSRLLYDFCLVGAICVICPEAPAWAFHQLDVVFYNQRTASPDARIATFVAA
jgi:hypothetical protein